jgi:hypothetical protein
MRGDNPDTSTPRMESKILFFDGHGNSQCVAFNYKKKNGDYKTGVYYGEDFDSSTGYKYAGIKSYDFTKVKLATFAGCKTAEGTDNITKRAVDEGAETAIGWKKSVGTVSFTKWLARYTNELALGKSVKEAVDYTNGFTYTDNDVKTVVIKGNENLTITSSKSSIASYSSNDSIGERKISNRKEVREEVKAIDLNIDVTLDSDKYDYEAIATAIKSVNPQFNLKEYEIYVTKREDKSSVIDLVYKIGDFETNSSYTVLINDGKAKQIIDNTINADKQNKAKNVMKTDCSIQNYTIDKIAVDAESEYKIEDQTGKYYYDMTSDKQYYIILTTLQHIPTNTFVKDEYFYEIK